MIVGILTAEIETLADVSGIPIPLLTSLLASIRILGKRGQIELTKIVAVTLKSSKGLILTFLQGNAIGC
jgi:hypothetical protein